MFWLVRLVSIGLAIGGAFAIEAFATRGPNPDLVIRLFVLAGLYVTLAVSLNLINGITGQFSMGHAAFYMVGAYTGGALSNSWAKTSNLPQPALMVVLSLAGALGAAAAGLIVGLPSLRLRGDYLAVVTLGFGEIIRIFVQNNPALGGAYGMNVEPGMRLVWMVWLLAFLCIAVCRNLLRTAHGLPFLAVREDEIASSAMGVNVTRVKVVAFVLGSAFAGAAGAMLANYEKFISPATFPMELSFMILTMVVLGGTGSITGSACAAVALFYLPERLRDMQPISAQSLVAWAITVFAVVAALKWASDHYHPTQKGQKVGAMIGMIVGGILVQFALAAILGNIPALKAVPPFEAAKLRMVIFAVALVILMLLRPQGVFGHHEFSWLWVKKLFSGRKAVTA